MHTSPSPHVIAVDWSGAVSDVRQKLWLAEVKGSELTRLECGRDREELTDHLIELKRSNPNFVVGLDFAFSFPQWFLEINGLTSASQLWSLARSKVEEWLRECPPPFWGRNHATKPDHDKHFRWTENTLNAIGGITPQSVFQVLDAGSVGTGSLRGLPHLKRLQEEGFSIWPFDEPAWPLVMEIYPRVLTGPVNKSDAGERELYMKGLDASIPAELQERAIHSEDAFDAAISAMAIANEWYTLTKLTRTLDPVLQMEGLIWYPGCELVLR